MIFDYNVIWEAMRQQFTEAPRKRFQLIDSL
jgi:hypothetical protein